MNIIFIAQECFPFAKASSLADLVSTLAKEIEKEGHNVKVFIPRYGFIEPSVFNIKRLSVEPKVKLDNTSINALIYKGILSNSLVGVYLIESQNHFSNLKEISLSRDEYSKERDIFFATACLETLSTLKFEADVIHVFNPNAAHVIKLIKSKNKFYPFLNNPGTIFTIYNLIEVDEELLNIINEAISLSSLVTTVSKTHAYELLSDVHGLRLSRNLISKKENFIGISSSIDEEVYNSETDTVIAQTYSKNYFSIGKRKCKEDLQNILKFENNLHTPIFSIVSSLRKEKGTDFLISSIPQICNLGLELIILGRGDKAFEQELIKLENKYKNLKAYIKYDHNLSKKIYAGSDFYLNLSNIEPSGMSVMNAMRYGAVPIAYATGAIKDIVIDFEFQDEANGFIFKKYDKENLIDTILKAIKVYKNKEKWPKLVKSAMHFEMPKPAKIYIDCYKRTKEANLSFLPTACFSRY